MITAIISITQVHGAEVWLAGWLLCAALYFVFLLIREVNRTSTTAKNVVFWFLAAEFFTDLIWAIIYYGNPGYINYGIAAVYGLLLWPVLLLAAGAIASAQNRNSHHSI